VHRHRIGALAIVALGGVLVSQLEPSPEDRTLWLTLVALPLGYGHLLGGLLFARRRHTLQASGVAFVTVAVLTLLAVYTWALPHAGWLLYPMFAVSAWHIFENDLALARRSAGLPRPGPIPRRPTPHLVALALSAGLAIAILSTADGTPYAIRLLGWIPARVPISLTDLAAAVLLYHAISWLWFLVERTRELPPADAARARSRLFWIHAAPLATNALLHAALPALQQLVASPSLYLYWSFLHALQTAWRRGLAPPNPALRGVRCRFRSSP
jgi:hypothetical protein